MFILKTCSKLLKSFCTKFDFLNAIITYIIVYNIQSTAQL